MQATRTSALTLAMALMKLPRSATTPAAIAGLALAEVDALLAAARLVPEANS
jgi:hypothetical protein